MNVGFLLNERFVQLFVVNNLSIFVMWCLFSFVSFLKIKNNIIITLLSTIREEYINLYSGALTFLRQQYDITANQLPTIPAGIASDKLSNTYNVVTFKGVNTSILWRNGYNALGETNYNATALNVLNFLKQLRRLLM